MFSFPRTARQSVYYECTQLVPAYMYNYMLMSTANSQKYWFGYEFQAHVQYAYAHYML